MHHWACIAFGLAASTTLAGAHAQPYPTKPVTLVVPFTAGGPTDTVTRSLGQAMTKQLGLVVDVPMTLVARADFPAANFSEFLKHIRQNRASINFANAGIGSASHLCELLFMSAIETNLTKDFEVGVWYGIHAPKATPKAVVDKLTAALQAGVKEPDFIKRMSDLGARVYGSDRNNAAAQAAQLKAEIEKWGPIIKQAGAYAD